MVAVAELIFSALHVDSGSWPKEAFMDTYLLCDTSDRTEQVASA